MKRFRKLVLVFAILALVPLSASGSQAETAGRGTQSSGPARLTVSTTEDLRIQDYETNWTTILLEKDSNDDLEFVLFL